MKIGPDRQTFWDWRAAMNFILGGTGSGLLVISAVAGFSGTPVQLTILAGAAMVATGLVFVWFEIGRPERFLNVFRNPYTSWMSREAWVAVIVLPLSIAVIMLGWSRLLVLLAVAALGFVYCQARILCASTGIPSWRRTGTLWLIVTTGLAEGVAIYLMFNLIRAADNNVQALIALALVLIGVRALLWWRWRGVLEKEGPRASFDAMRRIDPAFLVVGNFLPALAFLASYAVPELKAPLVLAGGMTLLVAGWILKYKLITGAAYTQGFALERIPARGGGSSGPGIQPGWR